MCQAIFNLLALTTTLRFPRSSNIGFCNDRLCNNQHKINQNCILVLVYLGQCLPVDQCHAVSCNDIISSLPSTFKNNMESCRAECCGEGKCSGSAIGGSIGDIDEDEG